MKFQVILCTACLCGAVGLAQAETEVVDGKVVVAPSTIPRPARGAAMKTVERQFGAPATRHPTVGKPPITRWDYPGFSVFFEGDRVITAVATGS